MVARGRGDNGDGTAAEAGHKRRERLELPLPPVVLGRDVLALNVAGFIKALTERSGTARGDFRRPGIYESDDWHHRLLRARRNRPRRCRAAEQRDELAPSHAGHGLPSQWVCRTISLPSTRWQVAVAGLNRSEFRGLPAKGRAVTVGAMLVRGLW